MYASINNSSFTRFILQLTLNLKCFHIIVKLLALCHQAASAKLLMFVYGDGKFVNEDYYYKYKINVFTFERFPVKENPDLTVLLSCH
jgi:hypothetical protein